MTHPRQMAATITFNGAYVSRVDSGLRLEAFCPKGRVGTTNDKRPLPGEHEAGRMFRTFPIKSFAASDTWSGQ